MGWEKHGILLEQVRNERIIRFLHPNPHQLRHFGLLFLSSDLKRLGKQAHGCFISHNSSVTQDVVGNEPYSLLPASRSSKPSEERVNQFQGRTALEYRRSRRASAASPCGVVVHLHRPLYVPRVHTCGNQTEHCRLGNNHPHRDRHLDPLHRRRDVPRAREALDEDAHRAAIHRGAFLSDGLLKGLHRPGHISRCHTHAQQRVDHAGRGLHLQKLAQLHDGKRLLQDVLSGGIRRGIRCKQGGNGAGVDRNLALQRIHKNVQDLPRGALTARARV
mmetsp:Transcript_33684/g.84791  ORF Transcript_33684/g.84791 Transcript_33684/m.84791 type:complete len:275 (+) Transcript_33684:127-951(+)